jgi:indole-3-glycerol phosphate synthase
VLLITKFLEKNTLQKLVAHTMKLKMEPIVEIHNKEELQKALTTNARIIAVNARDVNTFSIDVDRACAIIRTIPKDRIILGFSGIKSEKEVDKYKKAGARGILMGTVLMRSKNPEKILTTFRPL